MKVSQILLWNLAHFFSLKKIPCTKVGLVLRYMYIGSWEEMGGLPQNVTHG